MLVMTLYFVVRDIAVWIVAFIIIWIPFSELRIQLLEKPCSFGLN